MNTIKNVAVAVAAAATVAVVAPAAAIPVDVPAPPIEVVTVDRPCYMERPGWNTPAGWEQPVCQTEIGGTAADTTSAEPTRATDGNRARMDFGDNGGA